MEKKEVMAGIRSCLQSFSKYHRQAKTKGSEASVHELRTNARRLRNSLKTHSFLFQKKKIKKIDCSIKKLAAHASELRDLDVFISFLLNYKKKLKKKNQQVCLNQYISSMKEKRKKYASVLKSKLKNADVMNIIQRPVNKQLRRAKEMDAKHLMPFFQKRIHETVEQLLQYDSIVHLTNKDKEIHEMRIKAKHLRYTLEEIGDNFDHRIKSYTAQSLFFHKILGEIHDYDVWIAMIDEDPINQQDNKDMKNMLKSLQDYCRRSRLNRYRIFVRRWDILRKNRFFENLLELVYAHG
ncbi:MAG: CHAD domain-containing protein [Candidatus Omnitrophica bacterium]|nr:CHAD domain-containing protein [Candidatus Omnitrophota bacterium]